MGDGGELLRIGEFSRLSRISVRMLRHYQDRGLLAPARVDAFSGYRYYRAAQLTVAHVITRLRDAGFPIEEMGRVLDVLDDPAALASLMDDQRRRLLIERDQLDGRLAALDHTLSLLKESAMTIKVRTITMPAMHVAALRRTIPSYSDEGVLWGEIMSLLPASGASLPAGGMAGATFYDEEYREADADVEIWVQVAGAFAAETPVTHRLVPAQEVVVATLLGDYSAMPRATSAIGAYISEHRLRTGPMFNVYRVGPASDPDPANWVTDVCFPVVAGRSS